MLRMFELAHELQPGYRKNLGYWRKNIFKHPHSSMAGSIYMLGFEHDKIAASTKLINLVSLGHRDAAPAATRQLARVKQYRRSNERD